MAVPVETRAPDHGSRGRPAAADVVNAICQYLLAHDGTWRAAEPRREHRCTAVQPPASLSTQTQRHLCLVEAHRGCPAFREAQDRRARQLARDHISPQAQETLSERRFARTIPVALEGPRRVPGDAAREIAARSLARMDPRRRERLAAIRPSLLRGARRPSGSASGALPRVLGRVRRDRFVVLAIAGAGVVGVLVFLLLQPPAPDQLGAVAPAPSLRAVAGTPSAEPTSAPTRVRRSPVPSPSPARARTYRVKRGDTLIEIASRFGTTVRELQRLNGIRDPRRLRVGQVLELP